MHCLFLIFIEDLPGSYVLSKPLAITLAKSNL